MTCTEFYILNDTLYPETKITVCFGKHDINIEAKDLLLPLYRNRVITNFGIDYVRIE